MGIAAGITAGAAVLGLGYGVYSGEQQKDQAKKAYNSQQQAQDKAQKQLRDKQYLDAATAAREATKARQRAASATTGGRKSTILTSPTGLPGVAAPTVGGKTVTGV